MQQNVGGVKLNSFLPWRALKRTLSKHKIAFDLPQRDQGYAFLDSYSINDFP
jgi:hypothetical protein